MEYLQLTVNLMEPKNVLNLTSMKKTESISSKVSLDMNNLF